MIRIIESLEFYYKYFLFFIIHIKSIIMDYENIDYFKNK